MKLFCEEKLKELGDARIPVAVGLGVQERLAATVRSDPGFDFSNRCSGTPEIRLVDDDEVGDIQHRDFLQLDPAAVVGRHNEDGALSHLMR